jgi:hypothetical protein
VFPFCYLRIESLTHIITPAGFCGRLRWYAFCSSPARTYEADLGGGLFVYSFKGGSTHAQN